MNIAIWMFGLVSISKYNDGKFLVPNILVAGSSRSVVSNKSRKPITKIQSLENVVDCYNQQATDELKTRNRARTYRQIRFDTWPSAIHYEFIYYKSTNEIAVELHLEGDNVAFLGDTLHSFEGEKAGGQAIEWDSKWSKQRGRIRLRYPPRVKGRNNCKCNE